MRRIAFLLVASLALVAAGCGGKSGSSSSSGGSVPESASLMPASSPLYVSVNTDFGGSQWTTLNSLLAKFPDKSFVTAALQQQLSNQGLSWDEVKSALGPDTALGLLAFTGKIQGILTTKSGDQSATDALIQKLDAKTPAKPTQTKNVDGWTVVGSDAAALTAAQAAKGGTSLADSQTLKDAFAALPSDALVKVFVDGKSIATAIQARGGATAGAAGVVSSLSSVAASVGVTDSGIEVQAVTKGALGAKTFKPDLLKVVPSGALVYLGFSDIGAQVGKLESNPQFSQAFGQIQTGLGVTSAQLESLLSGEGAIYVRAGSPVPEVTIVLADADAAAAVATLDKLTAAASLAGGTAVQSVTVGGVPAKKLSVRGIPIYYANVDGKLVITDSEAGITGLTSSGDKLADDPAFKDATSAAGLPSETTGFVYVNIKDIVPLIDSFASLAGQSLPPQATANAEHLTSFVAYGTASGDTNTFKAFVEIK